MSKGISDVSDVVEINSINGPYGAGDLECRSGGFETAGIKGRA